MIKPFISKAAFIKTTIISLALVIGVTGCTSLDPYTGESKVNNTTKGAGIGAGAAAVIAYIANRKVDAKTRNKRILQSAAGGAAIGGGVGLYMDKQEKKLRDQLANSGVSVQRDGDNINLVMPGNITFATNSSSVNPNFLSVLDSVAVVLNKFNQTIVAVSGHTDSSGKDDKNQTLSQARAQAVADYLLGKQILADRLVVKGFGSSVPVADNATPEGREQNRRVEITLLPVTQEE